MGLSEQQAEHVEFYFSDSNLPFDKFLFESVKGLDLSVVVAFKRMQQILKKDFKSPDEVPSEDIEAVAALLRASESVEVSDDGFQIRRKDMPQDWDAVKAAVDARSVHAEPFPYTATIESIGQLFAQHGEVRQVRLQRFVDPQVKGGVFAGSAIVEMGTQEQAEALLAGEVQHAGAVLRLQSKAAHLQAREAAGLKDGQRDTRHHCPAVTAEGLPEDLPDPDADRKAAQEQNAAAKDAYEEGCFVKFEVQGDVPEAMPSGAALRTMLGGTAGGLAYVQYQPDGDRQTGLLRFNAKENADTCMARADETGVCTFELEDEAGTLKLKLAALTGEEEAEAWRKYRAAAQERDARENRKRGGNFGGGGGHHKRARPQQ